LYCIFVSSCPFYEFRFAICVPIVP
jgi:hypothetical protein